MTFETRLASVYHTHVTGRPQPSITVITSCHGLCLVTLAFYAIDRLKRMLILDVILIRLIGRGAFLSSQWRNNFVIQASLLLMMMRLCDSLQKTRECSVNFNRPSLDSRGRTTSTDRCYNTALCDINSRCDVRSINFCTLYSKQFCTPLSSE